MGNAYACGTGTPTPLWWGAGLVGGRALKNLVVSLVMLPLGDPRAASDRRAPRPARRPVTGPAGPEPGTCSASGSPALP